MQLLSRRAHTEKANNVYFPPLFTSFQSKELIPLAFYLHSPKLNKTSRNTAQVYYNSTCKTYKQRLKSQKQLFKMLLETEKDNDHRVSLMWSLRNKKCTNKQTRPKKKKKKKTLEYRKQTRSFQWGWMTQIKGSRAHLL